MLIQALNRTNAEKVFVVVRNDTAASIAKGYPVVYTFDGTRDGLDVVDANAGAAAKSPLLAGCVNKALAAGETGLAQCYGARTDAPILKCGTATNANGAIGDVMILHTAISAFSGVAAGAVSGWQPGVVLGQTMASSASTATTVATVFLRLM